LTEYRFVTDKRKLVRKIANRLPCYTCATHIRRAVKNLKQIVVVIVVGRRWRRIMMMVLA